MLRVGSPGPGPTAGVLSQGLVWGGLAGPPTWVQKHLFPTCVRPPTGPGAPVTVGLGGGTLRVGSFRGTWSEPSRTEGVRLPPYPLPMSCLHTPPTSQDLVSLSCELRTEG